MHTASRWIGLGPGRDPYPDPAFRLNAVLDSTVPCLVRPTERTHQMRSCLPRRVPNRGGHIVFHRLNYANWALQSQVLLPTLSLTLCLTPPNLPSTGGGWIRKTSSPTSSWMRSCLAMGETSPDVRWTHFEHGGGMRQTESIALWMLMSVVRRVRLGSCTCSSCRC